MLLFSTTIFLSSFLLFLVQPMIARMILPWFGGTAAVWATCMVFFQVVLLLGYLYAHKVVGLLKRFPQRALHTALLAASLFFLPLGPNAAWKPSGVEDPMTRILGLLATSIGPPYLLLATTGPLLQAWYVQTRPGAIPYRLFALSNLGSLLALLAYPTLIEPRFGLQQQSRFWSAGFLLFAAALLGTAWLSLRRVREPSPIAETAEGSQAQAPPRFLVRVDWVLLAMCPSILLLALTNAMTQDVAAIPFLWVIPLSLYLLSFILCFDTDRWYRRWLYLPLGWAVAYLLVRLTMGGVPVTRITPVVASISGCFFIVSMICHGELAARKPHPAHLTLFYLMVSLGGALGGVLVALAAPLVFRMNYELSIGLSLFVYLIIMSTTDVIERERRWVILKPLSIAAGLIFFAFLGYRLNQMNRDVIYNARNFYGELRVMESGGEEDWAGIRRLMNGTIDHGEQFLHPKRRREAITYYCAESGVGMALNARSKEPSRVGVIGLGTGSLAAYCRLGDTFRFYDINPLVVEVAKTYFYYVPEAKGKIEIVMGDARLSMEREPPQKYDLIAVDAFSSDSIPVHLLTQQAVQLYVRHLTPDGVLAIHVSNRYIELEPVLEQLALREGKRAATVDNRLDPDRNCFQAVWVLLTARADLLSRPEFLRVTRPTRISIKLPLWTDDYSNVFRLLK